MSKIETSPSASSLERMSKIETSPSASSLERMTEIETSPSVQKYECKQCEYSTDIKSNYSRHNESKKHLEKIEAEIYRNQQLNLEAMLKIMSDENW